MSTIRSRWDLGDLDVAQSAEAAALKVVERTSRDKQDVIDQWETAVRLAHANGASLRDIARVAGVAPQTVSNICSQTSKGSGRRAAG